MLTLPAWKNVSRVMGQDKPMQNLRYLTELRLLMVGTWWWMEGVGEKPFYTAESERVVSIKKSEETTDERIARQEPHLSTIRVTSDGGVGSWVDVPENARF